MNKNLFVILALLILLGGGLYFMTNQNKNNHEETTNNKPVAQSHRGYEVDVVSGLNDIQPQKATTIRYGITNDKGEVLKDFIVAHEKLMHFIVVRDDLQHFQHLHPDFNSATGEFSIDVTFPTDGSYTMFPDFTPGHSTGNHMALPVTTKFNAVIGDREKYKEEAVNEDTQKSKTVKDYQIDYSFSGDLKSQTPLTYTLSIYQNGQPVTNLEKYLGALGHSVILKEETLDYIHTHAGEQDSTGGEHSQHSMSPVSEANSSDIDFTTTFPEPGKYKIFTQFQHQGEVFTTDYVIEIK